MTKTEIDLEAQRNETESKLAVLRMSSEAAETVRKAVRKADDAVKAYKAKADVLEGRLDEIDAEMDVRVHDKREAKQQKREDHRIELIRRMMDAEERRLQSVERYEKHIRAAAAEINESYDEAAVVRDSATQLAKLGSVPTTKFLRLSQNEFDIRTGARMGGVMMSRKKPMASLGQINWGGCSMYMDQVDWRNLEEKQFAPDIQRAIDAGTGDGTA